MRGGGRRLHGQTSRCEAGREQRKVEEEQRYRQRLLEENRKPRAIDVAGMVKAGRLMDQGDEKIGL